MDIEYPMFPINDVHYQYDMAGRRAYWEDGSGSTRVYYDELGNVKTHLRHIVMPYDYNSLYNYAYNFRTETYYDSFGRVRQIIYPDGEDVQYRYFSGGNLRDIRTYYGNSLNYIILDDISYDARGRQICRQYGNGVVTHYTYSPERNWLTRPQTVTPASNDTLQNISYSYDAVGNITSIRQQASVVSGLGGSYTNTYKYDSQYRLVMSSGVESFPYDFYMDYSPAGRIGHRFCGNSGGEIEGSSLYGYDTLGLTHQPRVIFDENKHRRMSLYWDADGNLGQMRECSLNDVRFHQWDDTDRLRMVLGPKEGGYYSYDAEGNRVYKLAGIYSRESVNGNNITSRWVIENAVLYPNPYLTITPTHYTKHYFAGAERVATMEESGSGIHEPSLALIGEGSPDFYKSKEIWWELLEPPYSQWNPTYSYSGTNECIDGIVSDSLSHECSPALLDGFEVIYSLMWNEPWFRSSEGHSRSGGIFYNHSDHLGSASWITEAHGSPAQYLHYLPYGEIYADQSRSFKERFKFTGKELDEETGYHNFEARNLLSQCAIFLSVDPLADKYPGIQPYLYCNGNPVKYIDPDGRGIFPSAKELREVGMQVMKKTEFQRSTDGTTFCNRGTQWVNSQAGDNSVRGAANEMGRFLRNPQNATQISQEEALNYANMGVVIFASFVNTSGGHGHVAVVAPSESMTYSKQRGENVVNVFNVGVENAEMSLAKAFGKKDVGFYILNTDLDMLDTSTYNGGVLDELLVTAKSGVPAARLQDYINVRNIPIPEIQ